MQSIHENLTDNYTRLLSLLRSLHPGFACGRITSYGVRSEVGTEVPNQAGLHAALKNNPVDY